MDVVVQQLAAADRALRNLRRADLVDADVGILHLVVLSSVFTLPLAMSALFTFPLTMSSVNTVFVPRQRNRRPGEREEQRQIGDQMGPQVAQDPLAMIPFP